MSKGKAPIDGESYVDYSRAVIAEKTVVIKPNFGRLCKSCGEKTVIRKEIQTRSGDEGATTIFKCTNPSCGVEYR